MERQSIKTTQCYEAVKFKDKILKVNVTLRSKVKSRSYHDVDHPSSHSPSCMPWVKTISVQPLHAVG